MSGRDGGSGGRARKGGVGGSCPDTDMEQGSAAPMAWALILRGYGPGLCGAHTGLWQKMFNKIFNKSRRFFLQPDQNKGN